MKNCYLALFFAFIAISPVSLAYDSDESVQEDTENPEEAIQSWSEFGCKVVKAGCSLCYELAEDGCSQVINFATQNPVVTMMAVGTILIEPTHAANCTGCAVCNCFCLQKNGMIFEIGKAADIKQCYELCDLMKDKYNGFYLCK